MVQYRGFLHHHYHYHHHHLGNRWGDSHSKLKEKKRKCTSLYPQTILLHWARFEVTKTEYAKFDRGYYHHAIFPRLQLNSNSKNFQNHVVVNFCLFVYVRRHEMHRIFPSIKNKGQKYYVYSRVLIRNIHTKFNWNRGRTCKEKITFNFIFLLPLWLSNSIKVTEAEMKL